MQRKSTNSSFYLEHLLRHVYFSDNFFKKRYSKRNHETYRRVFCRMTNRPTYQKNDILDAHS